MQQRYVHGYDAREQQRLRDQGHTLVEIIHGGTAYPPGCLVLEAGCGIGVQTIPLAQRNPMARFVAIDRSGASLAIARESARAAGISNVAFGRADIYALPFATASFDHVFVCFVLEHLPDPGRALLLLQEVLKPGGTMTIVEGDHGSTYFHPDHRAARNAVQCLVRLQAEDGGDALIGRRLYPLMTGAGLSRVRVRPAVVYVDASRPQLVENFTRRTFIAMVAGIRDRAIAARLTTAREFDAGIRALERTTAPDGVFCYTFFKGVGER